MPFTGYLPNVSARTGYLITSLRLLTYSVFSNSFFAVYVIILPFISDLILTGIRLNVRGSLRSELYESHGPSIISTRIYATPPAEVSPIVNLSEGHHHNDSNVCQTSIITMPLEDIRRQVSDGPVSFVYSFTFPWSVLIHLGQDPPSHLCTVLGFRKGPHGDCHNCVIAKR